MRGEGITSWSVRIPSTRGNKSACGRDSRHPATQKAPAPAADIEAMADVVIRGEYGNGAERRDRLGHLYEAVQVIVNRKLI